MRDTDDEQPSLESCAESLLLLGAEYVLITGTESFFTSSRGVGGLDLQPPTDRHGVCEFAVSIVDRWQGRGVGGVAL